MIRSIVAAAVFLGFASLAWAAPPGFHAAVLASAPSLYYQFNESSGNVVDFGSLGAAFDGTCSGTPVRAVPTFNGDTGIQFDSSDDYVSSNSTAPSQFTGNPAFSIEAIVYIGNGAIAQVWPPFLHWGNANPQTGRSAWFSLQNNHNNIVYVGFYNSGLRTVQPMTLGAWHHIVWVRDGAPNNSQQGSTLYIDGVSVALQPDTDLQGPLIPDVTSTNFLIDHGHDLTRYFQGVLDELALYDHALSPSEIMAHVAASGVTSSVENGGDAGTGLRLDVYPNPFRSGAAIDASVPQGGQVLLSLFDPAGRVVTRLVSGSREAGTFKVQWDGRNDAGRAVAPGVYFLRLQAGARSADSRIVLLK